MNACGFLKIPSEKVYLKNLHALSVVGDEELVELIDSSGDHTPFEITESCHGWLTARFKYFTGTGDGTIHSLDDPLGEALSHLTGFYLFNEEAILMVGAGFGYHVGVLCDAVSDACELLVYERYPEFLKIMFSVRDYSKDILKGRLKIYSWINFPALLWELSRKDVRIWQHPRLSGLYGEEYHCISNARGNKGKVILLITGLLSRDLCENLLLLGMSVLPVDVLRVNPEDLEKFIKENLPLFAISINYVRGIEDICSRQGLPYVVWEIDPTIEVPKGNSRRIGRTLFYTYRKSRISLLRQSGFPRVLYLPLATNHFRFKPIKLSDVEMEKYGVDVSFVGSSMVRQGNVLKSMLFSLVDSSLQFFLSKSVKRQLQDTEHFVLPYLLKHLLSENTSSWIVQDKNGKKIDGLLCLAEECASARRVKLLNELSNLASEYAIRVWGDEKWRDVLDDRIIYCGTAGHYIELPLIYNGTKVNLDINRIYQKDMVTLRVFDVCAVGGFVLADYSEELTSLFGKDIAFYKSGEEFVKLTKYYLEHPQEREDIARASRRVVLREHTIRHRLERIISDLKILGWV